MKISERKSETLELENVCKDDVKATFGAVDRPENFPNMIGIGAGEKTEKWGKGDGKKNLNRIKLMDDTKRTKQQAEA